MKSKWEKTYHLYLQGLSLSLFYFQRNTQMLETLANDIRNLLWIFYMASETISFEIVIVIVTELASKLSLPSNLTQKTKVL